MIDIGGWIKLYRELLEKAVWLKSTAEQKAVLITILLSVNHRENEWEWQGKKFVVQPGQFITSLPRLAESAGVSVQNVRSALARFTKYEFLTDQSTATGRLITVVNWGFYQGEDEELNRLSNRGATDNQQRSNSPSTDGQQGGNRRATPNKKDKNVDNDENDEKGKNNPPDPPPGGKSMSRKEEIQQIWNSYSFSPELSAAIKTWGEYKAEKNQKYKPRGLKSLLTVVQNNATKYGDAAVITIINESMASGYEGITWTKLPQISRNVGTGQPQSGKVNTMDVLSQIIAQSEGGEPK